MLHLKLLSRATDASPSFLQHLQSYYESQYTYWTLGRWGPGWERGCSVAQNPGNGSSRRSLAGALFSSFLRSQSVLHLRFSCQVAGGGGVQWFRNGELVGDRSGGFAKKILLLVQRN